ncbi:MAG: SDR family oxidoreductase [Proteobacteria bacterium]|nr:SDR family oxidoreductase [Pseudomonadota bacterium]
MNLSNNTILISGGATGIGFALAHQLANRENRVIICGRSESNLAKARAAVPALATRICDVADADSRRDLVQWLNTNYPDLNIVINNAGVQHRRLLEDGALDNVDQEVAINFTAPIHLIGNLLPLLRRQPKAVIVNVTSALAFAPLAGLPVYCATKAALHSFTMSLRQQLKTTGVRVVEMIPPLVDTNLGTRDAAFKGGLSAEDYATEALLQLENDKDEVLVGTSANTRKLGEALFERMNGY